MPLTSKGEEIRQKMEQEYGMSKGKQVFYASKNAGTITGVDSTAGVIPQPAPDFDSVVNCYKK